MDGIVKTLIWTIEQFNNTHYGIVALMTFYIADYFHTLITEISVMWSTPWTIVKVIFFISRYSPFLDGFVGIASFAVRSPSVQLCDRLLSLNIWSSGMGQISAYLLLSYRVYAITGRTRPSAILLSFLAIALITIALLILIKVNQGISVITSPAAGILPGCLSVTSSGGANIYTIGGTILAASVETILFGIIYWARVKKYREDRNQLMRKIYGDALVYYSLTIVISVSGIVVWFTSHGPILELAVMVPRTLISMVSCKIILNIRKYGNGHHGSNGATTGEIGGPLSGLRFEHSNQTSNIDTDLGLH